MFSPFFYRLESEHINQKVGLGDELRYPNEAFHTAVLGFVLGITVLMIIMLLTHTSVHFAIFLLHIDFCFLVFLVIVCIRTARDWINTLICTIDSIFVTEEVLRRKFYGSRSSIDRETPKKNEKPQYVEVTEQQQKKSDFLSVDMGKLDAAFKGGMFNRH